MIQAFLRNSRYAKSVQVMMDIHLHDFSQEKFHVAVGKQSNDLITPNITIVTSNKSCTTMEAPILSPISLH